MEFKIRTIDNSFSYTSVLPVGITMANKNNISGSNTQGFMRKVQKGKERYEVEVILKVSALDLAGTFIPMLNYNDDIYLTLDRNLPGRGVGEGVFTYEDMEIIQEFFESGTWEYEIKCKFVEVIYT